MSCSEDITVSVKSPELDDLTETVKREIEEKFLKNIRPQTHIIMKKTEYGWMVQDTDYEFNDILIVSIDTINKNPLPWVMLDGKLLRLVQDPALDVVTAALQNNPTAWEFVPSGYKIE